MRTIEQQRPQPPYKGAVKHRNPKDVVKRDTPNKREQLRNERANIVCQELRYQIANDKIDLNKLCDLVIEWKKVALRSQMKRP